MKRKIGFLLIVLAFITFLIFAFRLIGGSGSNEGVIKITSIPNSTIFVDNAQIGKTPHEGRFAGGNHTVKLIPDATVAQLTSWEGTVTVGKGAMTFVNRELGPTELTSSGEILWLEKITAKGSEVTVVSTPVGASILVDGVNKGYSPVTVTDVVAGEHTLTLTNSGYMTRSIKMKTTAGYRLNISSNLSLSSTEPLKVSTPSATSETPTPSLKTTGKPKTSLTPSKVTEETIQRPYVLIEDTPTGFLRVRLEPSTSATEAARVNPGEKFPFLSEKSGWYEITYEEEKTGWVSAQYAQKVE